MDNQTYKRLQKMLMHGVTSIEEDDKEEEIESEPPRCVCIVRVYAQDTPKSQSKVSLSNMEHYLILRRTTSVKWHVPDMSIAKCILSDGVHNP